MPRPKGSKNKPKIAIVETTKTVKRPRGRPRKNLTANLNLPNTNMEDYEDEDKKLEKMDIPEIEEEVGIVIDTYKPFRWTSDDWNENRMDHFSISSDFMY